MVSIGEIERILTTFFKNVFVYDSICGDGRKMSIGLSERNGPGVLGVLICVELEGLGRV
jgi:hypothetical protein